jgi:hypothetical protein
MEVACRKGIFVANLEHHHLPTKKEQKKIATTYAFEVVLMMVNMYFFHT